jgi:hypothetical protein
LVIGIGGSGAETLAGNRRHMIEAYGSMENVPMIRYLYIDTDPTWWQEQLSTVEKHIQLSTEEFVDIQIPGSGVASRNTAGSTSRNWRTSRP